MNKEQQELLDGVYVYYCKSFENQTLIEEYSFDTDPMTQFMFINKCKNDKDFSEKWGLKIEERELIDKERIELAGGRIQDKYPALVEMSLRLCDERDIPTKLITITYQNKKTESYE
jgi:hypothetical protein